MALPLYPYVPYAVARFDGYLVFKSCEAGWSRTGEFQMPILRFKVVAGSQLHPVYAIDKLAILIFAYCKAAQELSIEKTQLQTSFTASWISSDECSHLIATHVEWHTSPNVRAAAQRLISEAENGRSSWLWPDVEIFLPEQKTQFRLQSKQKDKK